MLKRLLRFKENRCAAFGFGKHTEPDIAAYHKRTVIFVCAHARIVNACPAVVNTKYIFIGTLDRCGDYFGLFNIFGNTFKAAA